MTEEEEMRRRLYEDILREFAERILIAISARLSEDVHDLLQRSPDAFRDYLRALSPIMSERLDAILEARGIEEIDTEFWLMAYVRMGEYLNGALPYGCRYAFVVVEEIRTNDAVSFMLSFGERSMFPELTGNTNRRTAPVRRIDDRINPNALIPRN